ncbi:MAG: hypothetical protein Q7T55_02195 [Solirubrobacteraceae bacterium]|nr:hypothetical protein [Solirubrobacteraceae bacterium]
MKNLTAIHLFAGLTVLLGVLMIVRAVANGGGVGAFGVLIGALFIAAGVLRLRLLAATRRNNASQRVDEVER